MSAEEETKSPDTEKIVDVKLRGLFNPENSPAVDPQVAAYNQWQASGGRGMSPYLQEALAKNPNLLPQAGDITMSERIGKYGANIFSSAQAQFPLAAQAINRYKPPQPPSVTAKMMADVVRASMTAPKASPEHEAAITEGWNKDFIQGVYQDGIKRYGAHETARLLSTGQAQTPDEQEYVDNARKTLIYYDHFADIDKQVGDRLQNLQKEKNLPDEEHVYDLAMWNQIFLDPSKPLAQKMEEESYVAGKVKAHEQMDSIVKKYVPENFKYGDNVTIEKSTDSKGNPIPGSYSEITITNSDGTTTNVTKQVGDNSASATDELIKSGSHKWAGELVDKYIDDPTDKNYKKAYDAIYPQTRNYIEGKMEHSSKIVLKREQNINIKTGDKEKDEALPMSPKIISFTDSTGQQNQDVAYATSFKPITAAFGTVTNAIKGSDGKSMPEGVTIGQNSKANGIVMLNVAMQTQEGGAGLRILGKNDPKIKPDGSPINTLQVPYVEMDVPTVEGQRKIDDNDGSSDNLTKTDYETVYVPLSEAQGDLINSADKEHATSIRKTIKQYMDAAQDINSAHSTKEAQKYYKENFIDSSTESPTQQTGGYHFN